MKIIDNKLILQKSLTDEDVRASLTELIEKSDIFVDKCTAKDTLYNMVFMYVKVRCFSKAKHILEKHKQKESGGTQSKSLRKSIKRSIEAVKNKDT